MENAPKVNLRLNNIIFKCILDGKYYNFANKDGFAVAVAHGVVPQQTQMAINMDAQIICEDCWKTHKDNKSHDALDLKDPSPIITAQPGALSDLRKGVRK